MNRIKIFVAVICFQMFNSNGYAQEAKNTLVIDLTKARYVISRNIYGHFAEHLGHGIYGGFWVGDTSSIPNVRGIRTDVVEAMKRIKAPVLRWPGGCFADEYHWKDGIGPRSSRPSMVNTNWGGVTEDNSFGTHEYLDLCNQIGCAPYISGNLGSGTVQELSQWVEYVNSDNTSPITNLRKKNGRDKPWGVAYWGLGNESWGCGGNMKPEYYADLALRYGSFMKDYGEYQLRKIIVGPGGDDYHWTEVVMREMGNSIWGLSMHYYTWCNDENATDVTESSWYDSMVKTLQMEELVTKNSAIMDKYDPGKSVALVVDEWGAWYAVEPGTNPHFLYQQNTLRDALIAGINLNIFNNHCSRVKMAAIAQAVNVLQSVILTRGSAMVLTPTYDVFDMYKVHQDAVMIPVSLHTDSISVDEGAIPALSASSSIDKEGKIHITLCNLDATKDEELACSIGSFNVKNVTGEILTSEKLNAHNTSDDPDNVTVKPFHGFKTTSHAINLVMPKHSVVVLELTGVSEVESPKIDPEKLKQGLLYKYYEGAWQRLPNFSELSPLRSGTTENVSIPEGTARLNFGLQFSGYIKIDADGIYQFSITSDDGSALSIDGSDVVTNDGRHAMVERSGSLFLTKGYHSVEIAFFQAGGGSGLKLLMEGPGKTKGPVENSSLFYAGKK
ncbi:MAG TPA: alpha-L-arabinofuranosidase C-terminal domain-containing protein [Bacteroidota bacterium]|nr:alpha-L-arabinofuranosidase C-terminal domain-containing protein [Bacteroidota bacterium]